MYTQCSSCATLFRIAPRHLRQAHGLVRCCLCHEVFDALPSLVEALPAGIDDRGDAPPSAAYGLVDAGPAAVDDLLADVADVTEADGGLPQAPASPAKRRLFGTTGWSAVILLLLAVLIVQYAYVMREELARYPRLRPWIETLCMAAGCELPLLRDVSRVRILDKYVGPHPASAGALLVKATMVNDTGFRQPYPQIRFTFLDPSGEVQMSRWFSPDAYLVENRGAEVVAGMPPQEPVAVRLELAGIGTAAIDNFMIDFR